MPRFERADLLRKFRAMVARGEPIVGGGAGTGLSAKCEEAGGIDLIVIYNSGRYRMAGRGSLAGLMPYGDANAIVVEMAGEVLPVVRDVPVLAGVCGTCPYVFDPGQAAQMVRAGADVLVPHMGLTTSGTIGARTALTLDEAVGRVQAMRDAAVAVNPDILVLCHGGPIAEPQEPGYVLARTTGVCGFFGASSMERLPIERALTAQVRAFTELSVEEVQA